MDEENKPGPTEWNAHPVGVGPWEDEHPGDDLRRLICGVVVDDDDLVELVQFGHQGLE